MFTVTVHRPAGQDRFGNAKPAADHTIDRCWTAPPGTARQGSYSEQNFLESTVEWDLDLYAPPNADLAPEDVVELPGDETRYQVFGKPNTYKSPTGWAPGVVARLQAAR